MTEHRLASALIKQVLRDLLGIKYSAHFKTALIFTISTAQFTEKE